MSAAIGRDDITTGEYDVPGEVAESRPGGLAGCVSVYRWEWAKLLAQVRIQVVVVAAVVAPFLLVAVLTAQSTAPSDTLFGRWVHTSGFSVPLVVLSFAAQWAFPALACIVAGDVFAAEDRHRTWRTILTRSRTRGQIFAGKAMVAATWSVLIVVLLGAASLAAGALFIGRQPMIGLTGQVVGPGRCAELVALSWLMVLPAVLGFAALGVLCSVLSRSSVVGIGAPVVLGLVMQLYSLVGGPTALRVSLLVTPFDAWHGLWTQRQFFDPFLQGVVTSAVYIVLAMSIATVVAARRDAPTA